MACPEFEELLSQDGRDHAQHCEECRALLEALKDVDATFEAAFAGVAAPPGLEAAVRARAARETRLRAPSLVPEILDFIGWAAVLALAAVLFPRVLPFITSMLAQLS